MKKLLILSLFTVLVNADSSYYEKGELKELQKMNVLRTSDGGGIEYYKTRSGKKIGITDEILVQCNVDVNCIDLLRNFELTDVSQLTDTIYIVKMKNYDDIFPLSRELFESGKVKFAHPNFVKEKRLR